MAVPGTIKNQQGITLIELLVSTIIMTILMGASFSLFIVYSKEIREGVAMTRLQMQHENISSAIASLTRTGTAVVKTSETTWPIPTTWTADSTNNIYFKNRYGTVTGGFQITGGYLQEYLPATGTWVNYKAGNLNVSVASSAKLFFLSPTRNSITITLVLQTTNVGTLYSLSARGDEFKCRN